MCIEAEPCVFLVYPGKLPRLRFRYPQEVPDICHGDDKTFFFAGIPCIWVCSRSPFCIIHTEYDSMDKVDLT